jgi:hypothetical protein
MSTEEDLGKEDSISSNRRAYMHSIRYNQKTTPCIKWREKLRETQLATIDRAPPPKNVERGIYEYVIAKIKILFLLLTFSNR